MLIIGGVRVRPEDADRYRAQAGAPAPERASTPAPAGDFDPSAPGVTADQVLTYLGTVGEAEATRVLDAEAAGRSRAGIVGKREQLLAAARERDTAAGNGGGGGAAT
jgi:hypothetical protein